MRLRQLHIPELLFAHPEYAQLLRKLRLDRAVKPNDNPCTLDGEGLSCVDLPEGNTMAFVRKCAAFVLLLFSASLAQAQSGPSVEQTEVTTINPTFTTIDVPGAGLTVVGGINNGGEMVGWYAQSGNTPASGFLFSGGNFAHFDYPGASSTDAFGINDSGLIVGTAFLFQNTAAVGFTYDGTTFTKTRVGSQRYTYAEGINNSGAITGGYGSFGGNDGYEESGAKFKKITPPGTYTLVYATGLNNLGQVVGTADEGSFFYASVVHPSRTGHGS
jgi:hypothetical protein